MISKKRWNELKEKEKLLEKAAYAVRVEYKDLPKTIERFLKYLKD